jgi:glutaconate CoA-transferase subunit A
VTEIAIAERGAHPVALLDEYGTDAAYVADYARMAKTEAGFAAWLEREVLGPRAAAAE